MHTEINLELRSAGGDAYDTKYSLDIKIARASHDDAERPIKGEAPIVSINYAGLLNLSGDPSAYGNALSQCIFADQRVWAAVERAQGYAVADEQPLQLRLTLSASEQDLVHSIHWEKLLSPRGDVLSLMHSVLFSRYLPSDQPLSSRRPRNEDLRVLVVVAAPLGLGAFQLPNIDAGCEIERIRGALGSIATTVLAHQVGAPAASLANIRAALREGPHLVVLIGHGSTLGGYTYLWLEDEQGAINRVDGSEFVAAIRQLEQGAPRPVMVALLTCQSAGPGHESGMLATLGPRLIDAGVAAVLAMQGSVTQASVGLLLPPLLRELRVDGRIDRAVAVARADLQEQADWWAPVLLLRARDARLWHADEEASAFAGFVDDALLPPPETLLFGREEDLQRYQSQLNDEGVAVICGAPGVGKTALAVAVARRCVPPERLFWTSFSEDQGLSEWLRRLRAFLANHAPHGQAHGAVSMRESSPGQLRDRFEHLLELLRGKGYLVCLDDLQFLEARAAERPLLEHVLRRLLEAVRAGELELLVTSWGIPAILAETADPRPLQGLSTVAVVELFVAADAALPDEGSVGRFATLTDGAPRYLVLLANMLEHGAAPAQLLADLEATGDTDGGAISEMHRRRVLNLLSERERLVLAALAVLGGSGSRRAVEALLDDGTSTQSELQDLETGNILSLASGPAQRYTLGGLLRPFAYCIPTDDERRLLHNRASLFYERGQERDVLKSIEHAIMAEAFGRAAQLSEDHFRPMLGRQQAPALRQVLARIDQEQLEPLARAELELVAAALARAAGESEAAAKSLERAAVLAEHIDGGHEVLAQAQAAQARLLIDDRPQEALALAQVGLQTLGEAALPAARAGLLIVQGAALLKLGRRTESQATYLEAERSLGRGLVPLRVDALVGLSASCREQGEIEQAISHLRQARVLAEELKDQHRLISIAGDLAVMKEAQDDWPGALRDYSEAIALADTIGSPAQRARLHFNRGVILFKLGDLGGAEAAFGAAQRLGGRLTRRLSCYALADVAIHRQQPELADELLLEAESLLAPPGPTDAELVRLRAELELCRAQPGLAVKLAAQALKLVQEGDSFQEGVCLRTQGATLLAAQKPARAATALRRSAALLQPIDSYECALSQAYLGQALNASGKLAQGAAMLKAARVTIERLGARAALEVFDDGQQTRVRTGSE